MALSGYMKYWGGHFVKYMTDYYSAHLKLVENNVDYKL